MDYQQSKHTIIFFDKMYEPMNEAERREFLIQFIEKVEIYEEEQENGQWLKSIEFKLPILGEDMKLSLDNSNSVESCVLLERVSNRKADSYVKLNVKMADYYRIKDSAKTENAEE